MAQSLTGVLRTLLLYIALDILLLQPRSAIGTSLYGGLPQYYHLYYLRYLRYLRYTYRSSSAEH